MDLITQGLLGGALAQSRARSGEAGAASAIGVVAGVLPDADTLIRSPSDPLLFLDVHRQFTHALVLVPLIALLAAGLAWPWMRARMPFSRAYAYALLGCALAGALDACTSYGTRLLWPFDDTSVALAVVAIVDPAVTLALAVGIALGLRASSTRPATLALVVVALYLGAGALQHQRAERSARALALERGHATERVLVKPTIGNLLLWRTLYVSNGRIHADAVRLPPFGEARVYAGESAALLDAEAPLEATDPAAPVWPALERFARFADGLVVRHPDRADTVGDARFAMLPTRLKPLWGIAPAASPGYPARFVTDRSMSSAERRHFVAMLLGR